MQYLPIFKLAFLYKYT